MRDSFRFITAIVAIILAVPKAAAQLPVAPKPQPSLRQLAKDYQRYGLPVPSKNAELV